MVNPSKAKVRSDWRGWPLRIASPLIGERSRGKNWTLKIHSFDVRRSNAPNHGEFSRKDSWDIEEDTPIAPLVFHSWFKGWNLSEADFAKCERVLGFSMPDAARHGLKGAIGTLLVQLAFPELKLHWQLLAKHLRQMIKAGKAFLALAKPSMSLSRRVAVLPAPVTVSAVFQASSVARDDYNDAVSNVELVIEHCEDELADMKPWLSIRGKKGDVALQRFLQVMVTLAGENVALPSPEVVRQGKAAKRTPLLFFSRVAVEIALREGTKAIERSRLSKDEKKAAMRALRDVSNKSDGVLIDQLRKAKKLVAAKG